MFASFNNFKRKSRNLFFNDKEAYEGTNRKVCFNSLELLNTSKGFRANIMFNMKAQNTPVVIPNMVTTQTISELVGHKISNLKILIKPNKVSISCKAYKYSFGAKGKTLTEAIYFLSERIRLDRYFA